jgi:hypothetical protein
MNLQKFIQELHADDVDKSDAKELILDAIAKNSFSEKDAKLIEEFSNVSFLSLNHCSLKNLNNFPKLPELVKVILIIFIKLLVRIKWKRY